MNTAKTDSAVIAITDPALNFKLAKLRACSLDLTYALADIAARALSVEQANGLSTHLTNLQLDIHKTITAITPLAPACAN